MWPRACLGGGDGTPPLPAPVLRAVLSHAWIHYPGNSPRRRGPPQSHILTISRSVRTWAGIPGRGGGQERGGGLVG